MYFLVVMPDLYILVNAAVNICVSNDQLVTRTCQNKIKTVLEHSSMFIFLYTYLLALHIFGNLLHFNIVVFIIIQFFCLWYIRKDGKILSKLDYRN